MDSPSPKSISTTGRRAVASVLVGIGIYGLAMGTSYPLFGVMLHDEATTAWNGLNASATGLGLLLGVLVVPSACRTVGAGRTTLIGVAAMATALAFMAAFPDFWTVFALRILLGFGANLMFVVAETALNVFTPPRLRGRVLGLYATVLAIGFVLGPAVVALFAQEAALLLVACAAVCALGLPFFASAVSDLNRAVEPGSAAAMLPAIRAMPLAFGFLFIASAVDAVMVSILPTIAVAQGFSLSDGAWLVAIFHVGLLLGQPVIGDWLDRRGRRSGVVLCAGLSSICAAVMLAAPLLTLWQVALIMLIWGGSNFGLYTAALALIGDRFSGSPLATATAAFAGVYAVASSTAPILAGAIIDWIHVNGFYGGLAVLYGAALAVAVTVFRPAEPTLAKKDT
ncbi:MAG: MFS transporter [Alphaproteobacteria bacterium]|nr:MFS transporter [Alphaproteobacteria bacterium]